MNTSYIKLFHESGEGLAFPSIPSPSVELQAAIIKEAHAHGLLTLAHALTQRETLTVLEAGVDGLAHCFCDSPPSPALIQAYLRNNGFLVPTLAVVNSMTGAAHESTKHHLEHAGHMLDEDSKTCFCGRMMASKPGAKPENAYQTVKLLKEAGVDIVAGTDSVKGLPGTAFGLSLHQEISMYTSRCELTPIEALRSATSVTARRLNLDDRGKLAKGLKSDVLMVKGDPTTDISCTLNIAGVWRRGKKL